MIGQSRRYAYAVMFLGAVLLGSLWLFVWQQVVYEREKTMGEASRELMNLAKAFEESVSSVIAQTDSDLVTIKQAYESDGPASPVIAAILAQTLKDPTRFQSGVADVGGAEVQFSEIF